MKSYTDLEQSKKLAEILPLESADMHYVRKTHDFMGNPVNGEWSHPKYGNPDSKYANYIIQNFEHYERIPCWTVAAIIELLPYDIKGYNLVMYKSYCPNEKNFAYELSYEGDFSDYELSILVSTSSIELIDACYEMIIKLKEKNLL